MIKFLRLDRPVAMGWIGTISLRGIAVAISKNLLCLDAQGNREMSSFKKLIIEFKLNSIVIFLGRDIFRLLCASRLNQLFRVSALFNALFCCTSCQPLQRPPEVTPNGELPTPPYSESSSHEIALGDDSQMAFSTATVEDTVASIEKLQAHPDRSRYRPHLEELSAQLFQKLATSNDPDTVIMTLFATASCHHPLSRTISRELIRAEHPIIQLAAVQALCTLNTSDADYILTEALRSDYPVIRLEAGWRIACKRSHDAFFHIDALSHKLPDVFLSYMPELFAIEG